MSAPVRTPQNAERLYAIDRKRAPKPQVELSIDGKKVGVPEGTTILGACATLGIEIPTLCFLETLHPVNVCRICVVELDGARVLVPSCSRQVEAGMVVKTRREDHCKAPVLYSVGRRCGAGLVRL